MVTLKPSVAPAIVGIAVMAAACGGSGRGGYGASNRTSPTSVQQAAAAPTTAPASATTATPAGDRVVEVVKSGFRSKVVSGAGGLECAFIVHNRDTKEAAEFDYTIDFLSSGGEKVGGTYGSAGLILPDQTRGVGCGGSFDGSKGDVKTLDVKTTASRWGAVSTKKAITTQVTELDASHLPYFARGTITNPYSLATGSIFVDGVAYDSAGNIVVGVSSGHDSVPAGGSAPFEVMIYDGSNNEGIVKVDVYVSTRGGLTAATLASEP